MNKFWPIISALIIGFLTGIGAFQFAIAGTVASHTTEIHGLHDTDRQIMESQARVSNRLDALINQNTEFVSIIRAQNDLMMQQYKMLIEKRPGP